MSSLLIFESSQVQSQNKVTENKLRAAHIFNMGRFLRFPKEFEFKNNELRYCAPSTSPVFEALKKAAGRKVKDLTTAVIGYNMDNLENLMKDKSCHIVYVGICDGFCPKILENFLDKPVLTIGEDRDTPVVTFIEDGKRLKFHIDRDKAEEKQLWFSSKILRLSVD